jgi:hypothetical protein
MPQLLDNRNPIILLSKFLPELSECCFLPVKRRSDRKYPQEIPVKSFDATYAAGSMGGIIWPMARFSLYKEKLSELWLAHKKNPL